jgi:hypothetical protein
MKADNHFLEVPKIRRVVFLKKQPPVINGTSERSDRSQEGLTDLAIGALPDRASCERMIGSVSRTNEKVRQWSQEPSDYERF